ncbi:MAG: DUF4838 domain-containing protein [bacterium]|nr:DUF4838 domain-containing protein [bacterium]
MEINKGSKDINIYTGNGPSEIELFAAKELQRYISMLTGEPLKIKDRCECSSIEQRIYVGTQTKHSLSDKALCMLKTGSTPLQPQEYLLQCQKNDLWLLGGDDISVLYAVYELLESIIGIKWPFPGKTVLPEAVTFHLSNFSYRYGPAAFRHRALTDYSMSPEDDMLDMIDWMAKNRFNVLMLNVNLGFKGREKRIAKACRKRAIKIEAGHHSFSFWVSPEKYFQTNPEFFSLVSGERSDKGQLCLTNEKLLQLFVDNIISFIKENPEVDTIGLYPNDFFGWCECESCSRMDDNANSETGMVYGKAAGNLPWAGKKKVSEVYFAFVGKVVAGVSKVFPDKNFSCLAYLNYIFPPQKTVLSERTKVAVAPFKRCMRHPLHDDKCVTNSFYNDILCDWRKVHHGELIKFEYYTLPDYMSLFYPTWNLMQEELSCLANKGIEGFVVEYKTEQLGLYSILLYILGKFAFHSKSSVESVIRDYCEVLKDRTARETLFAYICELTKIGLEEEECIPYYDARFLQSPKWEKLFSSYAEKLKMVAIEKEHTQDREIIERFYLNIQHMLNIQELMKQIALVEKSKESNIAQTQRDNDKAIESMERVSKFVKCAGSIYGDIFDDTYKQATNYLTRLIK